MPKKITRDEGAAFERKCRGLLALIANTTVENEKLIRGKKVDIYCEVQQPLIGKVRIAVECKYWARPLTRKDCATIIAEYRPLIDERDVDQFLLVTDNGIVPNAKSLFESSSLLHRTFRELSDTVLDPGPLVQNMTQLFEQDALNKYYISQWGGAPSLKFVNASYDLIFDEFIDFAVEEHHYSLEKASAQWVQLTGKADPRKRYSEAMFERCMAARLPEEHMSLEQYIEDWLESDTQYGIALLGTYGMGKSSFAKRIAHIAASAYTSGATDRIPFLIELKDFGSHQDIRGLVTHELTNKHRVANGSYELFQSLNKLGRFFIILDGFDEMKVGMTLDSMLYNFAQLTELFAPLSRILLCGRPTVFENQSEQSRILKGEFGLSQSNSVKYIPVQISPFGTEQVLEFLGKFSALRYSGEKLRKIRHFLTSLSVRLQDPRAGELRTLVSRPVHLPMLCVYAAREDAATENLHRAELYDKFISEIIFREMQKRAREFGSRYSNDVRREFARLLAVVMWKNSEARSIKYAEIPEENLKRFDRLGSTPLEAVRRDLTSACFLERKPPDILFMPHKSFLEFLVAEHLALSLRAGNDVEMSTIKITEEVLSFLTDMLKQEEWSSYISKVEDQLSVRRILRLFQRADMSVADDVFSQWLAKIAEFSSKTKSAFVEHVEFCIAKKRISNHHTRDIVMSLLAAIMRDDEDYVSFNAYRALANFGEHIAVAELAAIANSSRMAAWTDRGWLPHRVATEVLDLIRKRVRIVRALRASANRLSHLINSR